LVGDPTKVLATVEGQVLDCRLLAAGVAKRGGRALDHRRNGVGN
jgi:hypothetical protein